MSEEKQTSNNTPSEDTSKGSAFGTRMPISEILRRYDKG